LRFDAAESGHSGQHGVLSAASAPSNHVTCQKIFRRWRDSHYRRCRSDYCQIMSERRPPWLWNTAILARLGWLLMSVVFAAYAGRVLAHWGWP
jgi:hypothetical protein